MMLLGDMSKPCKRAVTRACRRRRCASFQGSVTASTSFPVSEIRHGDIREEFLEFKAVHGNGEGDIVVANCKEME